MQINNFYLEGYVSQNEGGRHWKAGNADTMTQMQMNTSNNC